MDRQPQTGTRDSLKQMEGQTKNLLSLTGSSGSKAYFYPKCLVMGAEVIQGFEYRINRLKCLPLVKRAKEERSKTQTTVFI